MDRQVNVLKLKRLGIDSQKEYIVYLHENCSVSKSEGFESLTRIRVHYQKNSVIATLNVIKSNLLDPDQASLSESAWEYFQAQEGGEVCLTHVGYIRSFFYVRQKLQGNKLTPKKYLAIIEDILEGKYSNTHISSFVSACAGGMSTEEIVSLTQAMIETGQQVNWGRKLVADKHCIGGLPGNRTTPIVVPIIAATGLWIPKTSSRAITSPAGTTDTMEVMTNVNLSLPRMRKVVERENACLIWGGAVDFSPADDIMVRIERTLNLDSEGQMIASILSKKASVGSSHVLLDIPVGPEVKVKNYEEAENLKLRFELVAMALGLQIKVLLTDGKDPIGRGIGPSLEAQDVLRVLRNQDQGLLDLKEKAIKLAGALLELCGEVKSGEGGGLARQILEDGRALKKFMAICEAQGGFREPAEASFRHDVLTSQSGVITNIHCGKLSRVAKLSGAPQDSLAGVYLHHHLQDHVAIGDPLYTIHAQSKGELDYALQYVAEQKDLFIIS